MQITCNTLYGKVRQVAVEDVSFRPAVYGLIIDRGRILLLCNRQTGKFIFPGGGVEVGEHVEDALIREVYEETGLCITTGKLITAIDYFFYYDPGDEAYHCLALFYDCLSFSGRLQSDAGSDAGEAEPPRWVPIIDLTATQFQPHFQPVFSLIKNLHTQTR